MHQHLYCTDWRRWVKKAFFRMASEAYEDPSSDESGGNDFESEISRLSDEYERLNDEVSRTLKRFHPPEDGEVEEST